MEKTEVKSYKDKISQSLGSENSYAVKTDKFDSSLLNAIPRKDARDDWKIEGVVCDHVFWDSGGNLASSSASMHSFQPFGMCLKTVSTLSIQRLWIGLFR